MDFPGEKLAIKMWETLVEKGVGSLLTPWQMIREGNARNQVRSQELLMLAQAEIAAADVRAGRRKLRADGFFLLESSETSGTGEFQSRIEPIFGLPDALRAATTTTAVERARSEINTAKAVLYAEEQLVNDTQAPPDQNVDDDWLFAWRDNAGKVSAEDLQRMWGSVLAGEVKSPGKYSLRTLDFLKTLSKSDAEIIGQIACYTIEGFLVRTQRAYLAEKGLTHDKLQKMQDIGVINGVGSTGFDVSFHFVHQGKFMKILRSNGKGLLIQHDDPEMQFQLEVCPLTEVGAQTLGLSVFEPDLEYLRIIGKQIASGGFDVHLCDWSQVSEDGSGTCSNFEKIWA